MMINQSTNQPTALPKTFSQFDRIVLAVAAVSLLLTAVFIIRGDRLGIPVQQLSPAAESSDVSTQAVLRVTFESDMDITQAAEVTVSPAVEGEVRWEGNRTLAFVPAEALDPNTQYSVTVADELQSQTGQTMLAPLSWSFRTGEPTLIFIAWEPALRLNQLYVLSPEGTPLPLTIEEYDVLDYAISPDGQTIAYSVIRPDNGSDLYAIDRNGDNRRQLLACPDANCSRVAWAPSGNRLVYERRNFDPSGAGSGPPRLWWLDVITGDTVAVFQDSQWLGSGAAFGSNGRYLSYIAPLSQQIQIYNVNTGQALLVPSRTGEPAAWSPNGTTALVSEIEFIDDAFSVHIFAVDAETSEISNLSGEENAVNDGLPIYSPSGDWIAFNRKEPRAAMGKQVWLMRSDGSEQLNLTNKPEIHFGQPAWSPDGQRLAVQGYALQEAGANPGIWLIDRDSGELKQIVELGILPQWLP